MKTELHQPAVARVLTALLTFLLMSALAEAQAPASSTAPKPAPSTYDRIWQHAELYHNEENPTVQSFLFTGRLQYDYAASDAEQGSNDEWNLRRLRLGARSKLFKNFLLHGEVELNPQESDPTYVRLTDMYLQWSRSPRTVVQLGKQSVPFTMDGATSSKELLTIDRSNLSNNLWFPQEYIPGVSVSGKRGQTNYRVGVYSAGTANKEFGEFNGSWFTLGVLGYDFGKQLGKKEALLTGSYVYQNADSRNTFTRSLRHIGSANFKLDAGRWGFRGDLTGGSGYLGQSSLWGVMAMPYVNLSSKSQVVGRYTFLDSSARNGIRLATYESRIVSGRGDRYSEFYGGINYYFYGHKLKWQTGVQHVDMDDELGNDGGKYDGVSFTTGFRLSW
jgi:phosphate-selective porin OprO and OprP